MVRSAGMALMGAKQVSQQTMRLTSYMSLMADVLSITMMTASVVRRVSQAGAAFVVKCIAHAYNL
jgi:hypothetical protein